MKVMIGENEALVIALNYLERSSPDFTYSFLQTPQRRPDDWSMVFEWAAGDGNVFDGPIIILVNKLSGRVRSLNEDIEERFKRG